MSRYYPRAKSAVMRPSQPTSAEDLMGALLVKQKPEVVLAGPSPLSMYKQAERIADPAVIATLLSSCSSMVDDHEDDLVFELLYLETLLAMQPVKVQSLLEQLGEVGEDVRNDVLPAGVIDLVAIQRRTRKLRQRLGAAASRVSAAVLMLMGGLPSLNAGDAHAKGPDSATFMIAAAPIIRVVDANSGQGVAGVQIKSMDEQLLGVTDATGQATLSDEYTETDLLSLEKDGYQMYLLDRAQLSSRNIVSMKPINDKPVHTAAKPTPKPPTPPKVASGGHGQAPKLEAPKAPTMPKSPQIRLPMKPQATTAPAHAAPKPAAHTAAAPKPAAHAVAPKPAAHAPAKPAAHAPAAHAPAHAAPKPAAVAPKPAAHTAAKPASGLPAAPHKPAYQPKPATAAHAPAAGSHHEADNGHSVMVPKRVPAPRVSSVASEAGGYYRVRAGDTLGKIAYRHLGRADLWPQLAAANRTTIKNPHFIRVGQRIVLPKADEAHVAKAPQATRQYVVKHGDSLFRIAGEQLGDATQWHRIFQLNRTAIANPKFIYPGQRITLPG